MVNTAQHKVTKIFHHEWIIGDEYEASTTAKDLHDGIWSAENEMRDMGIDLSYDDAYHFRAGDGGQIILFLDRKSDE